MPGPVLLFRQHRGLSWAGTTQRAQEYPPQHRETVSMGVSPSPFSLPSHRGRISPSIQPGKSACSRNRFLGQLSEALQHAHPRGWALRKGKRLAGTKLGGAFAKEGRIIGSCVSFSCSPPPPPPPLETASALWTSSFWPGKKAPGTRIQGCPGQGRCDCVSQTLQNESPCGVAYTGYFRTLLLQTVAKGGGRLFKEEKLSLPGFVYPSKCQRGVWNLRGALGFF